MTRVTIKTNSLTGTEKQVKWAEDIRTRCEDCLNRWHELRIAQLSDPENRVYRGRWTAEKQEKKLAQQRLTLATYLVFLRDQTEAAWWIKARVLGDYDVNDTYAMQVAETLSSTMAIIQMDTTEWTDEYVADVIALGAETEPTDNTETTDTTYTETETTDTETIDTADTDDVIPSVRLLTSIASGLLSDDVIERSTASFSLRYITIDDLCEAWVSWGVTLSDIQHLSVLTNLVIDETWDEERGRSSESVSALSPYLTLSHIRYVCDQILRTHDLYVMLDDEWTEDDEHALRDEESLIAYEDPTDDDIISAGKSFSEWTEWMVLSGEMERIDTDGESIWVRVPNRTGGVCGEDAEMIQEDAERLFEELDPMQLWFQQRYAESQRGETPSISRRWEVELVCQVCSVDEDTGIVCVRDDAMSRRKSFDVCDDSAAQRLCDALLKIL